VAEVGLERSRTRPADSLRYGAGAPGLQRADVTLTHVAFSPHRHDRYALGITLRGVQAFRYRGASRICLPGQLHLLHPDELHDGAPAAENGFSYRIVYVAPELVREASANNRLPFVTDPVHAPRRAASRLWAVLLDLLDDIDEPIGPLRAVDAAVGIADGLAVLADRPVAAPAVVDTVGVRRAKEYLVENATVATTAATLEIVAGIDRYKLVRHFKAAYGTPPDRFRLLRRLDLARAAIEGGEPIALAAAAAGFADQSHLTRHFKRAFGMTPAQWCRLTHAERVARPQRDPHTARRVLKTTGNPETKS
jgi:AraC-like DNA-binding protein